MNEDAKVRRLVIGGEAGGAAHLTAPVSPLGGNQKIEGVPNHPEPYYFNGMPWSIISLIPGAGLAIAVPWGTPTPSPLQVIPFRG